jgi:hypothetical protein
MESEGRACCALFRQIGGWVKVLVVATSISAWPGRPALAESIGARSKFDFNIPAQPLDQALEAFGATTRLQVLYETSLTAGRLSTEVRGPYPQDAALRLLLVGTGLDFNFTEDRAFTLVPAEASAPVARYSEFLGGVQSAVLGALCRRVETRPDASRLAFQFFVGGSGEITNLRLLGSPGVASRDAAIRDALQGTTLKPPPIGMPQPITMVLRAGAAGDGEECTKIRR